jgi:hypothetical protein
MSMNHIARVVTGMILALTLATGLANVAAAGGKKVSGLDLYKDYCKPCHLKDSPNGEVTPMTLIQDQWERFFNEKYVDSHAKLPDPNHDNKPFGEVISAEELESLKKWVVDHAADSEHPMTCG